MAGLLSLHFCYFSDVNKNEQPSTLEAALKTLGVTGAQLMYYCLAFRYNQNDSEAIDYIAITLGGPESETVMRVIERWPDSKGWFDAETGDYVGE